MITHLTQATDSLFGYGHQVNENYDPLEIITIARLAFMPKGTKIAFHTYSIELQRPGYIQPLFRKLGGSSHNDLDRLNNILKSAIAYYRPKQDPVICELFRYVLLGLERLKHTYQDVPGVQGNIQNMITTITTNLPRKGKVSEEGDAKKKEKTDAPEPNPLVVKEISEGDLDPVVKKIKAIWNKKDLDEIVGWFKDAEALQKDTPVDVKEKAADPLTFIQSLQMHKQERFKFEIKKTLNITY